MRPIVLAAALAGFALPAQAQRIDTRVRELKTYEGQIMCIGHANRDLQLFHDPDGRNAHGKLFQRPVAPDPVMDVTMGLAFQPREGTRHGVGTQLMGIQVRLGTVTLDAPIAGGRLILDGTPVAWEPIVGPAHRNANIMYVLAPPADRFTLGERVLATRWIDVELLDASGTVLRRYRYDGARMDEAAETLSIINWSCNGARAD